MELALLVWLISWLNPLWFLVGMSGVILFFVSASAKMAHVFDDNPKVVEVATKFMYFKTSILLLILSIIIPNEKTAQYMATAYLVQITYESDFVQKATPLAQTAVLNQLESWAKDNKEVATLVEQVVKVNKESESAQ